MTFVIGLLQLSDFRYWQCSLTGRSRNENRSEEGSAPSDYRGAGLALDGDQYQNICPYRWTLSGWCDGTDDPDPAYQPDVSAT